MRTSPSQFKTMVEYMERKGDLLRPAYGSKGKAIQMKQWMQLQTMLNSDPFGDPREHVGSWKKVWSDFKSNIKKKAARIHQAQIGTGGVPALNISLTPLEQRVINIMDKQQPKGFINMTEMTAAALAVAPASSDSESSNTLEVVINNNTWESLGPSSERVCHATDDHLSYLALGTVVTASRTDSPLATANNEQNEVASRTRADAGRAEIPLATTNNASEARMTASRVATPQAATNALGPQAHQTLSLQRLSARDRRPTSRRPTHSSHRYPTEQFIRADSGRKIKKKKQNIKLREREVRVKEMYVEMMNGWQEIAKRALTMAERYFNKLN